MLSVVFEQLMVSATVPFLIFYYHMNEELSPDSQEKVKRLEQALEEARQINKDWIVHGLDFVKLYVEDWDGDWAETWGDDEDNENDFKAPILNSLESDNYGK